MLGTLPAPQFVREMCLAELMDRRKKGCWIEGSKAVL